MGAKADRRRAAARAAEERRRNRQDLAAADRDYKEAVDNLKGQPVTDYFADDNLKYTGVNMDDVATAKKFEIIFRESLIMEIYWKDKINFKLDNDLELKLFSKINFISLIKKYFSKKIRRAFSKIR